MHPHDHADAGYEDDDYKDDDEPLEREDFATRKARRLRDVKEERIDLLVVGASGLAMLAVGAGLCWLTAATLRRGWMDIDDADIISPAQEPGWFYGFIALGAAMGLFAAQLGVRMLLHTRREALRTARLARRVARAGTQRR